eukprot:gene7032-7246_t
MRHVQSVFGGPAVAAELSAASTTSFVETAKEMGKQVPAVVAAPGVAFGELADLNADVRDTATNYRDPAIAAPQDTVADAVSGTSTPDLSTAGDSLSNAADQAAAKAKSALKGISSLPSQAMGELADLNADVRDISKGYRDPAGAIQQDKAAGALSGSNTPDLSSAGNKLSSAAEKTKAKAKSALKGISSLPGQAMGELADLNADVRDISKGYRDPAGAIQQDKAAGD